MYVFYNDLFLKHDTGAMHPENWRRLDAITNRIHKSDLWSKITLKDSGLLTAYAGALGPGEIATLADAGSGNGDSEAERLAAAETWVHTIIGANHDLKHIQRVKQTAENGPALLDGDTHVVPDSYRAALLAVTYGLWAARVVHSGETDKAMLWVRPPGHHATPAKAMGFCLFNNIAITAHYLRQLGYKKILIFDFDVHHGNGTQDSFYGDDDVLFISTHQMPLYPGTGAVFETGTGAGKGYTLNVPFRPGSTEADYRNGFDATIRPKIEEFQPEVVLISAGFDAHTADPLAQIDLKSSTFNTLTQMVMEAAGTGKVISFLEGGYAVDALAESVEEHIGAMVD